MNHTLMNDFVSMPNDEINRYMKMEKLLENKISRRFKVRRLEIHDLGISWNIFTAGTVSPMKIMSTSYQRRNYRKKR